MLTMAWTMPRPVGLHAPAPARQSPKNFRRCYQAPSFAGCRRRHSSNLARQAVVVASASAGSAEAPHLQLATAKLPANVDAEVASSATSRPCFCSGSLRRTLDPGARQSWITCCVLFFFQVFAGKMYQWAATLTQHGRNLPFALPLRTDVLDDGFKVGKSSHQSCIPLPAELRSDGCARSASSKP
jgi:hypothetical protein